MQVELFNTGLRLSLFLAGLSMAFIAILLLRQGPLMRQRIGAAFAFFSSLLLVFLAMEWLSKSMVNPSQYSAAAFNEYRWILLSSWDHRALLLALLSALLSLFFTAWSTRGIRPLWKWALVLCFRSTALMAALILFFQPAIELRQVAREFNRIALLVDDSLSMELSDDQGQQTRRQRMKKLLQNSKETIAKWNDKHIIDPFLFSTDISSTSLESIGEEKSKGSSSLFRHALEQIRKRYSDNELAGIVLLSDGIATGDFTSIGQGEFHDFVQQMDAPIHTVWTAKPGLKDMAVNEIRADEFAFVRTVTQIKAVIHSTGYAKKRIPVTLSSDGKAMRRKWIEVGPGESTVVVAFEFTPSHVGKYVYKISIPVEDNEAIIENNHAWFVVRVIRDKIRVLQVAGQPSWDVRALRGMLKQNPNVDLISFFILRTPDDIKKANNDELSLIPFPTRELFKQELPSFDLVILQNFNYLPYGIGQYLENIRSYVEGGGGLMMLGGPLSFGSGAYANTPLAKVLPVTLPRASSETKELLDTKEFRPRLTEIGKGHPITSLRYEENDNLKLWKNLPPLEGVNKVLRAKSHASVLAVHPRLRDKSNKAMPVIIAGNYKKGRTLAVTTDSLWRWGFIAAADSGNDGRHYLKLWDNAIRWLIQDPELRYLHINSDKNVYALGAPVGIDLRLLDQDYSPLPDTDIQIELFRGFDPKALDKKETLTLKTNLEGKVHHEFKQLEAGVYRIHATAKVRGKEVKANDIFLIDEVTQEYVSPAADPNILKKLSTASQGTYMQDIATLPDDLSFVQPKIIRVDKRSDVPLWSHYSLMLLAMMALGLEWVLRQRSGNL